MIRKFFEWLIFTVILGCKTTKQKDKEMVENMSMDEKEAFIKEVEEQIK